MIVRKTSMKEKAKLAPYKEVKRIDFLQAGFKLFSERSIEDVTLNDVGPGTVNGVNTGNESLFGVVYWFRPYSKARKLFMFITYYALSMLACNVLSRKK